MKWNWTTFPTNLCHLSPTLSDYQQPGASIVRLVSKDVRFQHRKNSFIKSGETDHDESAGSAALLSGIRRVSIVVSYLNSLFLLVSSSSNVLPWRGEWRGVGNVFPSAALIQPWLLILPFLWLNKTEATVHFIHIGTRCLLTHFNPEESAPSRRPFFSLEGRVCHKLS